MNKPFFYLLFFLICNFCSAQNLVPNGDFENYTSLPIGYGQINRCTGWNNALGTASPDFYYTTSPFGTFFGTLAPHSGNGMVGICTYHSTFSGFREYIGIQLSQPLIAGTLYRISFFLSSAVGGAYTEASNHIGAAFSSVPLVQPANQFINFIPQAEVTDTLCQGAWQQFVFYYTPSSNEQYLTFGNFNNDLNTYHTLCHLGSIVATYYFIDDFEVIPDLLPIKLLYFEARPGDEAVLCKWKTATETNNEYFEIERSSDGKEFQWVGRVAGFGAGTSTENRDYSFVDKTPCRNIVYYRLKQVDIDGAFSYSDLVAVNCKDKDVLTVYPNPTHSHLTVSFVEPSAGPVRINLLDYSGRITLIKEVDAIKGFNEAQISIEELSEGFYFLDIHSLFNQYSSESRMVRFIKN